MHPGKWRYTRICQRKSFAAHSTHSQSISIDSITAFADFAGFAAVCLRVCVSASACLSVCLSVSHERFDEIHSPNEKRERVWLPSMLEIDLPVYHILHLVSCPFAAFEIAFIARRNWWRCEKKKRLRASYLGG